jgi:hypothetical protein
VGQTAGDAFGLSLHPGDNLVSVLLGRVDLDDTSVGGTGALMVTRSG